MGPTALACPTNLTLTVTFNPLLAMVMNYSHAEVQGQRSVGSEDIKQTNERTDGQIERQTDGGDCITSHANAVGKHSVNAVQ